MNPKCAEAFFSRGEAYEILKKKENALEDYGKCIQLDSGFDHAYIHRAILLAKRGEHKKALKDLETAYKLNPKNELSYLYNGGIIYTELEQYKKALEFNNRLLKSELSKPVRWAVYNARGIVYGHLKEYKKSLDDFNQAMELNPKSATIYNNRGAIYFRLGQYDKAIGDFEKATELDPRFLTAHFNRGQVYGKTRQFERALEAFRCATELQPENTAPRFQLGLTYENLRQFDKALEEYDKILALDPSYAHVYTHKGIIHGNLCEFEEAIRNLGEAIRLDSKEDIAYANRAIGHTKMGNFDLALRDFEKAVEVNPSLGSAHFGKGKVLCYLAEEEKMSFKERKMYEQKVVDSFRKALQNTEDSEGKNFAKWWLKFFKKYCDASMENKKRLRVFAEVYEDMVEVNLFSTVLEEQTRLSKFMRLSKTFQNNECFFLILRRWNSFTPLIPGKSRSNLGGGYFFVSDGQGIVIDPGYNFVENFIRNNFSLGDIDNIILTHAHDDHTADFEALLSLFSKSKGDKKINFFTNLGASVKFAHLVSKNESIIENVEILNENQVYPISPNLMVKATKAMHKDILTEFSSKGLIFELKRGSKNYRLGITGDTMLFGKTDNEKDLYSFFENVDVLILHLGSIHKREFELTQDNFEVHRYDGEHLGIRGIVNLVFQCRPKLAILSELGEELKEFRAKVAYNIDNSFENYDSTGSVRVIPGDIGLKVVFDDSVKVACEICGASVGLKDIKYCETLINNKIAYHCKHHKREEIVDKFRKEEEKELRVRAESMGCTLDLISPIPQFVRLHTK